MTLAEKFAAGETVFTAWSNLPEPLAIESLCQAPFDAITLDMQHGGHSDDSVLRCLLPITASGKPGLVRIPVGRFDMASRALDFGAQAVIAPMINSAADARAFASFMKYPPLGERSWGAAFALARRGVKDAGSLLAGDNKATLAFAMIETRRAYEAADEILAVDGIDGLFVGPSDLSIAWTGGQKVAPMLEDMMEAVAEIGAKARRAGKYTGFYLTDMAGTGRIVSMGYQLLAIGPEAKLMSVGAKALIDQARGSIS